MVWCLIWKRLIGTRAMVPGCPWCLQRTQAATAMPRAQRCQFRALFPDASAAAVDLLEAMLQFDPRKRITVEQARAPCLVPCTAAQHDAQVPCCLGGAFRVDVGRVRMPCMLLCTVTQHAARFGTCCLQGLSEGVCPVANCTALGARKDGPPLPRSGSGPGGALPAHQTAERSWKASSVSRCTARQAQQGWLPAGEAGHARHAGAGAPVPGAAARRVLRAGRAQYAQSALTQPACGWLCHRPSLATGLLCSAPGPVLVCLR